LRIASSFHFHNVLQTHGITEYSSGLIYYGESGALNEAWSDIFGVLIDRQEGARGHDIWILGDKISQSGEGLRDMSDPASMGHFDYYPDRYIGTEDCGGVHWNSGIANLAFKLLITGGTHPRGKSSVVVRGLIDLLGDEDFAFKTAGEIFFCANDDCLTQGATFEDARHCTATICGPTGLREDSDIVHSIHTAWFAVGVGDDPSLTSTTPADRGANN
jgi:bacillolysin